VSALRRRIAHRARLEARHAFLRVVGREIVCAACGRPIFRALPLVWRGRVKLIGAAKPQHNVRVAFDGTESIEFRHVELDRCPSPERPWVT
jgi:hypothetical protein